MQRKGHGKVAVQIDDKGRPAVPKFQSQALRAVWFDRRPSQATAFIGHLTARLPTEERGVRAQVQIFASDENRAIVAAIRRDNE